MRAHQKSVRVGVHLGVLAVLLAAGKPRPPRVTVHAGAGEAPGAVERGGCGRGDEGVGQREGSVGNVEERDLCAHRPAIVQTISRAEGRERGAGGEVDGLASQGARDQGAVAADDVVTIPHARKKGVLRWG